MAKKYMATFLFKKSSGFVPDMLLHVAILRASVLYVGEFSFPKRIRLEGA